MKLDGDLQALVEKIDLNHRTDATRPFDDDERTLMEEAIQASQRRRNQDIASPTTPFQREINFFIVCLGFGLVAYALLMMLQWLAATPLGGLGVFGMAFLIGSAGAVFRDFYLNRPNSGQRGLVLTVSAAVILLSGVAILGTPAVGGVVGLLLGAVFYRTWKRRSAPTAESGATP